MLKNNYLLLEGVGSCRKSCSKHLALINYLSESNKINFVDVFNLVPTKKSFVKSISFQKIEQNLYYYLLPMIDFDRRNSRVLSTINGGYDTNKVLA